MKFMQRSLMGLFLLALTFGVLAMAGGSVYRTLQAQWSKEQTPRPQRERIFSVNVLTSTEETTRPIISAFGEIRSRRTLDLRSPGSGTIVYLVDSFVEGGVVKKNDLLLRLDPADAQTLLDVARTEILEAEAELGEASGALMLAEDELAAAISQVALRLAALERQKSLLARGVGIESAVETAAFAQSSAEQAVLGRRQALANAKARINSATTQLARRNINLNEAIRRVENTELYAEFDGVLSDVNAVVGGLIGNNEKIGRLIDPRSIEVDFRISNTQFARLVSNNNGQALGEVTVELDLLGDVVTAKGVIERVSAEVGEGLTGRRLFASLNPAGSAVFRPGDFVSVKLSEPPLARVVVLPASAVNSDGFVLVIGDNDRLEDIQVSVLRRQGDEVIVRAPDLLGREYVRERSPLLGAGIRVKPIRQGAPAQEVQDMVELTPELRAQMIAFVQNNSAMPKDAKERVLNRLNQPKIPAQMVERLKARMGG